MNRFCITSRGRLHNIGKHSLPRGENPIRNNGADVAELVDARDLKSLDGNVVWVRVPPPAPSKIKDLLYNQDLGTRFASSLCPLCVRNCPWDGAVLRRPRGAGAAEWSGMGGWPRGSRAWRPRQRFRRWRRAPAVRDPGSRRPGPGCPVPFARGAAPTRMPRDE